MAFDHSVTTMSAALRSAALGRRFWFSVFHPWKENSPP